MDAKMQVTLLAALVPLVFGAIWYNPLLLGRLWAASGAGLGLNRLRPLKIILLVILTYIGGYYIARALTPIVIHQRGLFSMLAGNPDMKDKSSALFSTVQGLMDKYGQNYRTFKHGALHGSFTGLYLVLSVLIVLGLLEDRKITWILIHAAFWVATLAVMGGIICQYMPVP